MPTTETQSSKSKVALGVGIALLIVGAVFWWGSSLFGEGGESGGPEGQSGVQSTQTTDQTRGDQSQGASQCKVTVMPTSVLLQSEPGGINAGLARAEGGEYRALAYREIELRGSLQEWYKIEANGKKGWVQNDALTLIENQACPP